MANFIERRDIKVSISRREMKVSISRREMKVTISRRYFELVLPVPMDRGGKHCSGSGGPRSGGKRISCGGVFRGSRVCRGWGEERSRAGRRDK